MGTEATSAVSIAFTQSGRDGIGVRGVDAPAGKGNLTLVCRQTIRAFGQHQVIAIRTLLNRHQNCRGFRIPFRDESGMTRIKRGGDLVGDHGEQNFRPDADL